MFLPETLSTSDDTSGSRPALARAALTNLPINRKQQSVAQHRVSKLKRNPGGQYRKRQKDKAPKIRAHLLQADRHGFVLTMTPTLQSIARFANRILHVRSRQSTEITCSQLQLEYPNYRIWRLLGDATLPPLSREDILGLQNTLVDDISVLYDHHLPYNPDLTRLEIVSKTSNDQTPKVIYRPLINVLDFDPDAKSQSLPWMNLKDKMIRFVRTQFEVLEILSVLSQPSRTVPLSLDLEPAQVVAVLRTHRPPVGRRNQVIRRVRKYSTELGQFVIEMTREYLRSLPWRMVPVPPESLMQNALLDRCSTINHVLGLVDRSIKDEVMCTNHPSLHQDRAALLVVYATLLIQLHAKTVTVLGSRGLLQMSSKETDDLYNSCDLHSVVRARQNAEEAVYDLAEQGIELDPDIGWFIRAEK
ncbi:hypothetical protein J3459_016382 [Metarhizium acridum]|uniref:uncharacterized protein n=1 Tax=Metarhizium acridum TaxID=92637 RepID=UPI001C6CCD93|nr:hypothetical protein J3458_020579 [Metarhizium acridum]KAG8411344.1 hypothetical protein J3459_016382 [Metarhizium acridum]